MSASDVEMSGEENVQVAAAASPQKELRKRKRVSDSASVSPTKSVSVSPKKSEQRGGRNPKAKKVVMESEEEKEEEEEEEEDEEEDIEDEEDADDEEEEEEGDEEEAWEVENIIGHKFEKGEARYHVKWVGFPDEENTWEPVDSLSTAMLKVTAYKKSLSAEALAELEGGKKKGNKRSVSPTKKVSTPAAKGKSTPKSAKKTVVSDEDEDEEEEVAVTKKVSGAKATPASASKSRAPAAKTKSVADFFKPKAAAAKTTAAPAKKNEKEKEPKKKQMTDQERLDKIMGTQLKAAKFAEEDPIGKVVEKGAAVLHTLIKYDADPEKLFAAVDECKAERLRNEELDKAAGKPRGTDKSRNEVYMLSEALENAMWWYADREKKLRNPEVKAELKVEPKVAESTVSSEPLELCTVSTVADGADGQKEKTAAPSPKKEVKDEDPAVDEDMEEDEEIEEVATSKPAAKAAKTTPAAAKKAAAAAKKPASPKKGAEPKKPASPKKAADAKKNDGPKKKVAAMFTPFKCKSCPEAYSTRSELLVHTNENHA